MVASRRNSPDCAVPSPREEGVHYLHASDLDDADWTCAQRRARGVAADGFAQRGKTRPNRMGASICRLLAVNQLQLTVVVPGCVSWNTCL